MCPQFLHLFTIIVTFLLGLTKSLVKSVLPQSGHGHIHGKHRFNDSLLGKYRGRNYSLVSGDYLNWIPKKIMG